MASVSFCALFFVLGALAQPWEIPTSPAWTYQDQGAWATNWPVCGTGTFQSPINIDQARVLVHPGLQDIQVNYQVGANAWFWRKAPQTPNILILQFNASRGAASVLTYGGQPWTLQHIRFHTPGEHLFNGVDYYAAEAEFVHSHANGTTLSLSVMLALGATNAGIPNLLFPNGAYHATFDPSALLPNDLSYMQYEGSLSTPPCTQITQTLILNRNLQIGSQQLQFLQIFSRNSRRGVQAMNNRTVYYHQQNYSTFITTSSCQAISNFNRDLEGWTEVAASDLLIANITYNTGKFAQGVPLLGGNAIPWSFATPIQYRGNLSHLLDGEIRYFIKPIVTPLFGDIPGIDGDVVIIGTDKELFFRATPPRGTMYAPSSQFFTEYILPFNDYSGATWRVRPLGTPQANNTNGFIPTRQDWIDVLAYVRCIAIRGRFNLDQDHTTWLDRVELCDGPNPIVPCPGVTNLDFRSQCSGHGACIQGVCSCRFGWTGADCSVKDKCAVNHFQLPPSVLDWKQHDEFINPLPPMQGVPGT